MEPMTYTFSMKNMFARWELVQFLFDLKFTKANTAPVKFMREYHHFQFNAENILFQLDPMAQWLLPTA